MITPERIRRLAELSLVLEPLLDKQDCTTRYVDLPDKSLTSFMIAAINIGSVIEDYAESVISHKNTQIFSHFTKALRESNKFKPKKYINVGLLEILFITVKVRIASSSIDDALDKYIEVLKAAPPADFKNYTNAFELAWSTSSNSQKQQTLAFMRANIAVDVSSFYDWHALKTQVNTDAATSGFQVTQQYIEGFPLIRKFVKSISEEPGLLRSIEITYNYLHKEFPLLKVGVLADLSAASMFLYLSFQDEDTYSI